MPGNKKYTRKIVPLDIREVSGGDELKDFPLPEAANDMGLDDPLKALSNYLATYDDAASDVTSPTIVDGRHSNLSNSYTTGNTTERSSIYSFGEDEFDREASRRVRYLFEEIDSMLFEDYQGPQHLYSECHEWVGRFPHLRILGQQKVAPQDKGYQLLPQTPRPGTASNMLTDVTDQDITGATHAMHELSITGCHLDVKSPPPEAHVVLTPDGTVEYSPYEKEEIFAQDGVVEDIIAVDYKSAYEDGGRTSHRHGWMPPVTPESLILDSIAVNSFDIVWSEIIGWMRHLVRKYAQQVPPVGDKNAKRPLGLGEAPMGLSLQADLVPASVTSSPRDQYHQSRETSMLSTGRLLGERRLVGPSVQTLESLLNISQKPVLKRDKSTLQDTESQTSFLPLSQFGVRPGSGLTRYNYGGRPGSSVRNDPFGVSGRMSASARKKAGRLMPIERTKTPGGDDDRFVMHNEVLRGHRLPAVPDRLSPPPPSAPGQQTPALTFPRNGALPPISYEQNNHDLTSAHGKKSGSMRASSAIQDKEPRISYRERSFTTGTNLNTANSDRPSTTHAVYRHDASYSNLNKQRATTPLGFSGSALHSVNSLRTGTGTVNALSGGHTGGQSAADVLSLDVRGSSINHPMDAAELEETEHIQDMIHSQWDYRGRLIHSSVFKNIEGANPLPSQLRRKQPYSVGSVR